MVVIVTRRRRSPGLHRQAIVITETVRSHPVLALAPEPLLPEEPQARFGAHELPLDRYRRQGLISSDHWQAGLRLREDFAGGEFERLSRCTYDGIPDAPGDAGDGTDLSMQSCRSRKRYVAAMRAVSPRLSPVVVHVCCLGEPAEHWAVLKRLPAPDAFSFLRKGLTQLADHYRRQASL